MLEKVPYQERPRALRVPADREGPRPVAGRSLRCCSGATGTPHRAARRCCSCTAGAVASVDRRLRCETLRRRPGAERRRGRVGPGARRHRGAARKPSNEPARGPRSAWPAVQRFTRAAYGSGGTNVDELRQQRWRTGRRAPTKTPAAGARPAAARSTARAARSSPRRRRRLRSSRLSQALISAWLAPVAAAELGDEPVALVAQQRAALERRERGIVGVLAAGRRRRRPRAAARRRAAGGAGPPKAPSAGRRRRSTGSKSALGRARSRGARAARRARPGPSSPGGRSAWRSSVSIVGGVVAQHRVGGEVEPARLDAARPGIVRTKRPTIWRKMSGVLAAVA